MVIVAETCNRQTHVLKKQFHMLGTNVLVCVVFLLKGEISNSSKETVGQSAKNLGTNLLDTLVSWRLGCKLIKMAAGSSRYWGV